MNSNTLEKQTSNEKCPTRNTCGSKYTKLLKEIRHPNTIESFVARKVVMAKKVAEYNFVNTSPFFVRRSSSSSSSSSCEPQKVRSSYNGDVIIPTTDDMLIANVYFGNIPVQFAVYDAKNESEQVFMTKNMSNDFTISMFFDRVNGGRFDTAKTNDPYSVNAFFSILSYYRMLYLIFGRIGLPNKAHTLVSISNVRFTNAFWTGYCMVFGNGKDSNGQVLPLTSMDVCGHELSHGLQTFTTEFEYQGESGALNESIADVFGTFLEFYVNSPYDTPDWTLGEQFKFVIRDFQNPKAHQQPCFYGGQFWVDPNGGEDNGGVHTNSGVTNYLCYLTVEGMRNFICENGQRIGDLVSVKDFTLKEYTDCVYKVILSKRLPTNSSLKSFATEMNNEIVKSKGEEASKHFLKCGKAVGLFGNGPGSFGEEGGEIYGKDEYDEEGEGTYGENNSGGGGVGEYEYDEEYPTFPSPSSPSSPSSPPPPATVPQESPPEESDLNDENDPPVVVEPPPPPPFEPEPPQHHYPEPIPPVPVPDQHQQQQQIPGPVPENLPTLVTKEVPMGFKRFSLGLLKGYMYFSAAFENANGIRLRFDPSLLSMASVHSPAVVSFWFVQDLNNNEDEIAHVVRNTRPSFESVLVPPSAPANYFEVFRNGNFQRQDFTFNFSTPSRFIVGFSCILSPWLIPEGIYIS